MVMDLNDTYKMMLMMTMMMMMMMIRMIKIQNGHNSGHFEATTSIFCMLIALNDTYGMMMIKMLIIDINDTYGLYFHAKS